MAVLVAVSTDYVIKKFLLWNRIIGICEENKIFNLMDFSHDKKTVRTGILQARGLVTVITSAQCSMTV